MEILGRTGLRVSVGVGITKVMASIASRVEKTGGLRIVNVGSEQLFLALLPVTKLHGIGQIDAIALGGRGISTIGQLRSLPKPVLTAAFGQSLGVELWNSARGRETAPRRPKRNWVLTLRVAKQRTLAQLTRIAGRLAAAFGKVASATPSAG
jgi:nucleotidyltransferase/DNA polymerase involved in DNA repair